MPTLGLLESWRDMEASNRSIRPIEAATMRHLRRNRPNYLLHFQYLRANLLWLRGEQADRIRPSERTGEVGSAARSILRMTPPEASHAPPSDQVAGTFRTNVSAHPE